MQAERDRRAKLARLRVPVPPLDRSYPLRDQLTEEASVFGCWIGAGGQGRRVEQLRRGRSTSGMGDGGRDECRQRRRERVFRLALDKTETGVRLYMGKLVSNQLGTMS